MDAIEVFRQLRPNRADGTALPDPLRWPAGWVHLSFAVARLTDALIQDEGSNLAAAFSFGASLDSPSPTGEQSFDRWRTELASQIANTVSRLCHEGHLVAGYRRVGGADDIVSMPREWWDTEDPFLRFRTWSIDPADPLSSSTSLSHWIWIEADGLETQIARALHPGDASMALPTWDGSKTFVALPFADALEIVAEAQPSGSVVAPGALAALCAAGAVRSLATVMRRSLGADRRGLGGREVESVLTWPIPADLWGELDAGPLQNWDAGDFTVSCGRDAYRLEGVMIDRESLFAALLTQGLVERGTWWEMLTGSVAWRGYVPRHGLARHMRPLGPRSPNRDQDAQPPFRPAANDRIEGKPAAAKAVAADALRRWVAERIKAGATLAACEAEASACFKPVHVPRQWVRDAYRTIAPNLKPGPRPKRFSDVKLLGK